MKPVMAMAAVLFSFNYSFAKEATPLRMMKVQGVINKVSVQYSPIKHKLEKVCEFSGDVPVYEALKKDESASVPTLARCETKVLGQSATIDFATSLIVDANTVVSERMKTAGGTLTIYLKSQDPLFINAGAGVSDTPAASLTLFVTSQYFKGSRSKPEEQFSVSATYTEK